MYEWRWIHTKALLQRVIHIIIDDVHVYVYTYINIYFFLLGAYCLSLRRTPLDLARTESMRQAIRSPTAGGEDGGRAALLLQLTQRTGRQRAEGMAAQSQGNEHFEIHSLNDQPQSPTPGVQLTLRMQSKSNSLACAAVYLQYDSICAKFILLAQPSCGHRSYSAINASSSWGSCSPHSWNPNKP